MKFRAVRFTASVEGPVGDDYAELDTEVGELRATVEEAQVDQQKLAESLFASVSQTVIAVCDDNGKFLKAQ